MLKAAALRAAVFWIYGEIGVGVGQILPCASSARVSVYVYGMYLCQTCDFITLFKDTSFLVEK